MLEKRKKTSINLKDIYTGTVVLVKEYNEDEKIPSNNIVIGKKGNSKIAALQIRKIAFAMKGSECIDLSAGLNKTNKYTYKVTDAKKFEENELNVKNNTLVISYPNPVGDVLLFAGFPKVVRKNKDVKAIAKLLLSSDKTIKVREHVLKLNMTNFIDSEYVERANEEATGLYVFKSEKLPIKPQQIEKVYKKYFK